MNRRGMLVALGALPPAEEAGEGWDEEVVIQGLHILDMHVERSVGMIDVPMAGGFRHMMPGLVRTYVKMDVSAGSFHSHALQVGALIDFDEVQGRYRMTGQLYVRQLIWGASRVTIEAEAQGEFQITTVGTSPAKLPSGRRGMRL